MATEVEDKPADTTVPDDSEAVEPANEAPECEAKIAWYKFNNVKLAQGYNVVSEARVSGLRMQRIIFLIISICPLFPSAWSCPRIARHVEHFLIVRLCLSRV